MPRREPSNHHTALAGKDQSWGRIPGAVPPLTPKVPVLAWLITAVVLVAVVVAAVGNPGALDDPDEGDQRNGFLIGQDAALRIGGPPIAGLPIGRDPVLVVFARTQPDSRRLASFLSAAPPRFARAVVLPAPASSRNAGVMVIADQDGELARRFGMPTPVDGGYPVGYALADSAGRVRYATLDPTFSEHAFELETLAGAVR